MLKIVVFIDWYKPAYKAGGPISSIYNLIELLGDEMEFYVVTSDSCLLYTSPSPRDLYRSRMPSSA